MEWTEEGVVLAARRHGEHSAIVEVFTEARGRCAGVVRGAHGPGRAASLQPGTQVAATWRGRLDEHIGTYRIEPVRSRARLMSGRLELAALGAVTSLLSFALPEREPHPRLYRDTLALLDGMDAGGDWPSGYLRWELLLLDEAGFGLDMASCAVTGAADGLAFVSPRTGRAVTEAGAGDWKERLLPLPRCLREVSPGTPAEVADGLATTGHFLERRLAPALGEKPLPSARRRLADLLRRRA